MDVPRLRDWAELTTAERRAYLEAKGAELLASAAESREEQAADDGARSYRLGYWLQSCPVIYRVARLDNVDAHYGATVASIRSRWLQATAPRRPLFFAGPDVGKTFLACATAAELVQGEDVEMRFLAEDEFLAERDLRLALAPRRGLLLDGLGDSGVELSDYKRSRVRSLLLAAHRNGAPLIVTSPLRRGGDGVTLSSYLGRDLGGDQLDVDVVQRLNPLVVAMGTP